MTTERAITPCLWFDTQAEEAARLYVSIFEGSKVEHVAYYGKAGFETHGRPAGSVMTVSFRLRGSPMIALNVAVSGEPVASAPRRFPSLVRWTLHIRVVALPP